MTTAQPDRLDRIEAPKLATAQQQQVNTQTIANNSQAIARVSQQQEINTAAKLARPPPLRRSHPS